MNNQDKIIKAAQAILNVLQEHDLTNGEALIVLQLILATILVDGLDNGDIDESAAERTLDAAALHVRQIVLSHCGKNKKSLDSHTKNFRERPKNDQ